MMSYTVECSKYEYIIVINDYAFRHCYIKIVYVHKGIVIYFSHSNNSVINFSFIKYEEI